MLRPGWPLENETESSQRAVEKPSQRAEIEGRDASGIFGTLRNSRYLQTIAALIFVSVIVSTLIDYQFKAAAKEAYPSKDALAGFFGSYYAWLSVVTVFAQVWVTGRLLMGLGLTASLLVLPFTLLAGSISLLVWPGLFVATATRLAEASLRTSVNHSGVEILYLPIPDFIKKKIKVFLDVTVERLGDGTAAFIILFYTLVLGGSDIALLSYFSITLIPIWAAAVFIVQGGYMEALRRSLAYREISLEDAQIDYAEKGTVEAVLKTLEEKDERAVLFGLELAEKLDPKIVVTRLPLALLHHPAATVRSRAIRLFAQRPDRNIFEEIKRMLQDENKEVQAEAISTAGAIFRPRAISLVRPYVDHPDPQIKSRALECLLRYGDAADRDAALNNVGIMANDRSLQGQPGRIEAARIMGEVNHATFPAHLSRLIREDPSYEVISEAMAAAGKMRYCGSVVTDIISRLSGKGTKAGARAALIQYGEVAVETLREALLDTNVAPDIRSNIPRTLSKIASQSAMDALLNGLQLEDRSIRYKVILGLEEMGRRFSTLKVDRQVIERAIISDAMLYFRRFAIFVVLFGEGGEPLRGRESLLRQALTDSMERVQERVLWLLALVYSPNDIRSTWAALDSRDSTKRAHAIEFLDNLLKGNLKQYVFPLFSDAPQGQRFRDSLDHLGIDVMDSDTALRMLLDQDDKWLTAATIWEIGLRGLNRFRDRVLVFSTSDHVVLREAAGIVIQRI